MGFNLKEQLGGIEDLSSLAKKRFDLEPLSQADLASVFDRASRRLNSLGQEFLIDLRELLWLRDAPNVRVASSLEEAKGGIARLLTETPGLIGYITGGLEGIHLQILLNGLIADGISTFIMGIEESSYSSTKGREPLYSTKEKVLLWLQFAPDKTILFVIPQRPDFLSPDDYYDWIAQYLGLFGNERIIYLGSKDDPQEIILAHQRRAASPANCWRLSLGKPPFHTSELLKYS